MQLSPHKIFLAHLWGALKCGGSVRPNTFEHYLTWPCTAQHVISGPP